MQNSIGNIIWSHGYSIGNSPLLWDMTPTSDGGYIMLGEVYNTDTNFTIHYGSWSHADLGIIKLDSNGNKEWSKVFGGTEDETARKILNCPV